MIYIGFHIANPSYKKTARRFTHRPAKEKKRKEKKKAYYLLAEPPALMRLLASSLLAVLRA